MCWLSDNQVKLLSRGAGSDHDVSRRYSFPSGIGTIQNCHTDSTRGFGTTCTPSFVPSGENASVPSMNPWSNVPRRCAAASTFSRLHGAVPPGVDTNNARAPTMSDFDSSRRKASVKLLGEIAARVAFITTTCDVPPLAALIEYRLSLFWASEM